MIIYRYDDSIAFSRYIVNYRLTFSSHSYIISMKINNTQKENNMLFTDKRTGADFSKDPCVVALGDKYYLYYSIWQVEENLRKLGIGIAVSRDLENWNIVGEIPLTQKCEENGIGAPGAVVLDGVIHMFYQTYGNGEKDKICHATSTDGVHFEKDSTNPVFSPSPTWCCGRAIDADVTVFGGRLYLYYATRDHEMKIQKIGVASSPIDSGFGHHTWKEELLQAVVAPEFKYEGECIEAPATFTYGGRVYMFYGGNYNCHPQQIGLAVSSDAVHFDKVSPEPFLPCGGKGEWNESESGHPYAFVDNDGSIYLFYQGSPNGGKSWYITKTKIEMVGAMPKIVK